MANSESIISSPNDYERLVRFVTRDGADFALCLVQYRDPSIRDRIIAKLEFDAMQLGVLVRTLDFGELDHNANLLEEMQKGLVQENTKVKALCIKRLDLAIADAMGNPRIAPSIQGLNLARDQIPKAIPARIVLWLSEAACNALATNTTDFYDVIYSFYQFDDQEPPRMINLQNDAPYWIEIALPKDIPRLKRESSLLVNTFKHSDNQETKADAAARIGEIETLLQNSKLGIEWLEKALDLYRFIGRTPKEIEMLLQIGRYHFETGDLKRTTSYYERAKVLSVVLNDSEIQAEVNAANADVLEREGKLNEALEIWQAQAEFYEKSDSIRSLAIVNEKIASIYEIIGKFNQAMEIRTKKNLPIFEQLNDVRLIAITKEKIADILEARGQLDEAFEIRKKETLPIFEKIGDIRSAAITRGKLAEILKVRGRAMDALEIQENYVLPEIEKLRDVRSIAMTQARIADNLDELGEYQQAFDLRKNQVLPIYAKIGDIRGEAVTAAKMTDSLMKIGQYEKALEILESQVLPVFEKIGDLTWIAVTKERKADILWGMGHFDKSIQLMRNDVLYTYESLGYKRSLLIGQFNLAKMLDAKANQLCRSEVDNLLIKALRAAREMKIPEAQKIQDTINQISIKRKRK